MNLDPHFGLRSIGAWQSWDMSGFDGMNFGAFGDFFGSGFAAFQSIMGWKDGPVNWPVAKEAAYQIAGEPHPILGDQRAQAAWADAVLTADAWLAAHTPMQPGTGQAKALSPHEWIDLATGPDGIARYVEPVANGMHRAFSSRIAKELEQSGMVAGAMGMMGGAGQDDPMQPISAYAIGVQVGQIAGHLANQLGGAWDLSVPTLSKEIVAVIGGVTAGLAQDHGLDGREVEFVLALRECAHRRLFNGVPWLLDHLSAELRAYGEATVFDTEGLLTAFGNLQVVGDASAFSDPAIQEQMQDLARQMHQERSPEQEAIQERLQTLVVLIYGYSEALVRRAGQGRLPNLDAILTVLHDKAKEPGVGEQALMNLLGLNLHPEDLAQGAAFCEAVVAARGDAGLDRVWADVAHLPSAAEVANPRRWLLRVAGEDAEAGTQAPLPEVDFVIPEDLSGLDDL